MNYSHIFITVTGLSAAMLPEGWGQTNKATPDTLAQECSQTPVKDSLAKANAAAEDNKKSLKALKITGGQLTIPFKIRRKQENQTFRLTTDVTLGAYVGLSKKLSTAKDYHLTIPVTAGVTFVNINNNNTTLEFAANDDGETDVVPGLTWSTGLILQLEEYNLGFIVGKDYASEVGDQWLYHRHWWWSFGLGYSFTK
ncbi:MAG: hypothetical protein J0M29_18305 [Chitinophagales bacterium]|nr:hypothetical protein [Chitinophagales bacterium]